MKPSLCEAADSRLRARRSFPQARNTSKAETRIAELDNLFKHLYEDNVTGEIVWRTVYQNVHDYELEQSNLKAAEVLREEIKQQENKRPTLKRLSAR